MKEGGRWPDRQFPPPVIYHTMTANLAVYQGGAKAAVIVIDRGLATLSAPE